MTPAAADAATAPLEDLFLHVFVLVDDLYNDLAPSTVRYRRGTHRLDLCDSEVITLSLMQEALSMDSEEAFHRFVARNYLHLFPRLVSRDRYHRRRKALVGVELLLFGHLARHFRADAQWLVFDSAPVETVAFVRSQSGSGSIPEAAYGYIPSKKRCFFGFRLHALVTDEGALVDFALSPANEDERTVARELLRPMGGFDVLADNGLSGAEMQRAAQRNGYALHVSPRPSRVPATADEARWRRWLRAKRDLVESVFAMLADEFRVETTRARSLGGVVTRVVSKLLAFNVSLYLNRILGRDLLAVKSLYL
jgi:transposase